MEEELEAASLRVCVVASFPNESVAQFLTACEVAPGSDWRSVRIDSAVRLETVVQHVQQAARSAMGKRPDEQLRQPSILSLQSGRLCCLPPGCFFVTLTTQVCICEVPLFFAFAVLPFSHAECCYTTVRTSCLRTISFLIFVYAVLVVYAHRNTALRTSTDGATPAEPTRLSRQAADAGMQALEARVARHRSSSGCLDRRP